MIKLINPVCLFIFLFVLPYTSIAQTKTITGTISNNKGKALHGAVIAINNTKASSVTDRQGKFIVVAPADAKTFTVSYSGMASREIIINKRPFYIIEMQPDTAQISDEIFIGYGNVKRTNVTSAISSITEKDIKYLPVTGVDQMLQGKVAGVMVTSNSGQPGGGVSVLVRGITTVNSNAPLYVVDGMPIRTNTTSGGNAYLGGVNGQTQQSILATLNPSDILSIDILKAAQAIYGADGGNGVVLITTKHGNSNANKLEYNVYYGLQNIQKKLPVMNLKQYAAYYNSLLNDPTSGVTDTIGEFKNLDLLGAGTNWQDAIFQQGYIQNHQLSFSGGQGKSNYYFSGNYYDQQGILLNTGFKRYALRMGVDQQIKTWLKAGVSANLSSIDQQLTVTDGEQSVIASALYNSPATPVKNFDGSFFNTIPVQNIPFGNAQNPVAVASLQDVHSKQNKVFGNVYAEVQFTKDISFRSQFNYDYQSTNNTAFQPNIVNTDGTIVLAPGKFKVDKGNSLYYDLQNYITYKHKFNKHVLNAVAGHENWLNNYDDAQVSATNLTQNIESLSAGMPDLAAPATSVKYATAGESYFARINYAYDDKYLLSIAGRADGSSNFGPKQCWGYFPAASLAWIISNEAFAKNNTLTFLKLRLGAGAVGVSSVPANVYSTNIRLANGATGLFGQPTAPGFIANVGNPNLHWEKVITYNIGVDATIANRIDVSVDVYKKITKDLLLATVLPGFSSLDPNPPNNNYQGIEPPFINGGQITNTGIDLSITSRNIQNKNFTWLSNFIFSHYTNRLDKLYAPGIILYGKSQSFAPVTLTETAAGKPVGSFYGYVTDGLYRKEDEFSKSPNQGLPIGMQGLWLGDVRYKDLNGDGEITSADQTSIGNPNPKFTYGLTNNFSYKGFDLSVFVQGVYGGDIFNYSSMETEGLHNVYQNQLTTVMNRYSANNPNGILPRFNQFNLNNLKISDRFIEDDSYLRIQNVTLGYNLPPHWINAVKMASCKIYISGQNLYTLTKYKGYDPELGAFNSNMLLQNIDYGHYPNPRTVTVGASVVF